MTKQSPETNSQITEFLFQALPGDSEQVVLRQEEEEEASPGNDDEIFLAKPIMLEVDEEVDASMESRVNEEDWLAEEDGSRNSSSNPPASLSFSEDSDTARIYDVQTMETRFEKMPKPTPVSPETIKFFAPKPVPKFNKTPQDVGVVAVAEKREKEVKF